MIPFTICFLFQLTPKFTKQFLSMPQGFLEWEGGRGMIFIFVLISSSHFSELINLKMNMHLPPLSDGAGIQGLVHTR